MISLIGMTVLLAVAFAFSTNRSSIRWRTVGLAFALQAGLGAFVLYVPLGQDLLGGIAFGVAAVIGYAGDGITFLFGDLGSYSQGFIFAIHVLSVIVFFSSLISVLYYLGIMTKVINLIGGGLQKLLGTSRPESMSAAANIFVGQTEAPLVVRPFIPNMTRSELFAVMVGGLASIAGSVLAGYAGLGIELKYLIAACFMAAPGALLMAKIIVPETEEPNNVIEDVPSEERRANVIDAAASGASSGMQLALNVGAMLLAFVALIALVNGVLGYVGGWFGYEELTMQMIFGFVFQPLAFIMGIPWGEAQQAGSFIGQKLVINEFVAYLDFAQVKDEMSMQSQVIITFMLCGFANFSSIAILLGGLGGMAPSRRKDIATMGMRALLAATLANLMSACIAGFFFALAA
ncbi:NupC/NupG family nucleoside CNT transporter [Aliidiomarina halalkaliphila]|uniref:Nucleoside permease n=1 Tax=Aliidiomarina halalkaliphila TaxID=2593535 RepID=A0A552X091_9GAMM|nr:NupC/NupG family nucleoside CNT transporter [Aliidiomarina halalkaliphila]TRW48480.1 NupC/NupG family nucleoside CNT transporter [Aliidiomarina halalkaliphila]